MSTATKKKGGTKKKGSRKGKKKNLRGLGSFLGVTNPKAKTAMVEAAKPLAIFGGVMIGNAIGKALDKVEALQVTPDPENPDKFQMKSLVKPLIVTTLGVGSIIAGVKLIKNENYRSVATSFAGGITASGLNLTAKAVFKKDLFTLSGLGNADDSNKEFFMANKDELVKLIQQNSFSPNLPSLDNESSESVSGPAFGSELNVMAAPAVLL